MDEAKGVSGSVGGNFFFKSLSRYCMQKKLNILYEKSVTLKSSNSDPLHFRPFAP